MALPCLSTSNWSSYMLLDQSPLTLEFEWLCMDVDGYKIVNIYKSPSTRLGPLDLRVFTHPCLYAGDFNCRHVDWGYDDNSPDSECLAGWASSNCLALLIYNTKDATSFYSGHWNTGTNPDLGFASVDPNIVTYWINVYLKSSPGYSIDLRL